MVELNFDGEKGTGDGVVAIKEIDIDKWFFGCEFECIFPLANAPARGSYVTGVPLPGFMGWQVKYDSSIRVPEEKVGVELVSPKLKGLSGVLQVKTVLEWAISRGAEVNASCGTHFHYNWSRNMADDDLSRVIYRFANAEKALYASTGTKKREKHVYCLTIKEAYRGTRVVNGQSVDVTTSDTWRRRLLNLTNLSKYTKRTLELRYAAGTLWFPKVYCHLCMNMGLIQKALANPIAKYDSASGASYHRGGRRGPGEAELSRIMYTLGWIKGRSTRVFGKIGGDSSDLPTIEQMRTEMFRLGRKYDLEV